MRQGILLLFVVLFLIPRNAKALVQMQPIGQGEYETMGRAEHIQQFGQEMLAIGGYLQHRVQVIVDPEVRQSLPRTSSNLQCLAYASRTTDEATGNIIEENQTQARFKAVIDDRYMVEPPDHINLEQGYKAVDSTRYALTPIQTRVGSATRYEWCLEPNKEYTLAIFKFTSTIPPGPGGEVLYTSSYQFAFTDLLPEEALARFTEEPCPPHYFRDEPSGACIRPVSSTINSTPVAPVDQWVPFTRIYLLMIFLPWLYNLIRFYQYRKRKLPFSNRKLALLPLVDIYFAVKMAGQAKWWYFAYLLLVILGTAVTAISFQSTVTLPADLWIVQIAILIIIFAIVGQLHWKIARRHHLPPGFWY